MEAFMPRCIIHLRALRKGVFWSTWVYNTPRKLRNFCLAPEIGVKATKRLVCFTPKMVEITPTGVYYTLN